jgi:hypothetical protein
VLGKEDPLERGLKLADFRFFEIHKRSAKYINKCK